MVYAINFHRMEVAPDEFVELTKPTLEMITFANVISQADASRLRSALVSALHSGNRDQKPSKFQTALEKELLLGDGNETDHSTDGENWSENGIRDQETRGERTRR